MFFLQSIKILSLCFATMFFFPYDSELFSPLNYLVYNLHVSAILINYVTFRLGITQLKMLVPISHKADSLTM